MTNQTALIVGIIAIVVLVLHNLPALLIGGAFCVPFMLWEQWGRDP